MPELTADELEEQLQDALEARIEADRTNRVLQEQLTKATGANKIMSDVNPSTDNPQLDASDVTKLIDAIRNSKRADGDTEKALQVFAGQVIAKDKRIEELSAQVGKVPDDIQTKLTAYEALGTPEELTSRLQAGEQAITERDTIKRESSLRTACELAGIDYSDLSTRKGVDDWAVEVKEETKDGKTVKVPYVTVNDAEGKPETKPMADKAFAEFPALAKVGQQQARVAAPVMGVSDRSLGPQNPVDAHIERLEKQKAEKINPLMPAKA